MNGNYEYYLICCFGVCVLNRKEIRKKFIYIYNHIILKFQRANEQQRNKIYIFINKKQRIKWKERTKNERNRVCYRVSERCECVVLSVSLHNCLLMFLLSMRMCVSLKKQQLDVNESLDCNELTSACFQNSTNRIIYKHKHEIIFIDDNNNIQSK